MSINIFITKHKILLFGLLISFLLIYLGKMAMKPINAKIVNAKSEIEKLNVEKNNLLSELGQIKNKEMDMLEKEKHLNEYFILKSKIADLSNPTKFFKDITDFNRVNINSLKPLKKEKVSNYIKMEINLNIIGSYENIKAYLTYLNDLPYLINIKKLDFSKTQEKNYNNVSLVIEVVGR